MDRKSKIIRHNKKWNKKFSTSDKRLLVENWGFGIVPLFCFRWSAFFHQVLIEYILSIRHKAKASETVAKNKPTKVVLDWKWWWLLRSKKYHWKRYFPNNKKKNSFWKATKGISTNSWRKRGLTKRRDRNPARRKLAKPWGTTDLGASADPKGRQCGWGIHTLPFGQSIYHLIKTININRYAGTEHTDVPPSLFLAIFFWILYLLTISPLLQ